MKVFKSIKKALIDFKKKYMINKKKESMRSSLKNHFRWFFEGFSDPMDDSGWMVAPVVEMAISKFEITDLRIKIYRNRIEFHVTLLRPGILIGKGGRLIKQLQQYLTEQSDRPVTIIPHTSNIW